MVRYHACWLEAVAAKRKGIERTVKRIEKETREKYKGRQNRARKLVAPIDDKKKLLKLPKKDNSESGDSFNVKKLNEIAGKSGNLKLTGRPIRFNGDNLELFGNKLHGKNLLKIIEDNNEVVLDEDWANQ